VIGPRHTHESGKVAPVTADSARASNVDEGHGTFAGNHHIGQRGYAASKRKLAANLGATKLRKRQLLKRAAAHKLLHAVAMIGSRCGTGVRCDRDAENPAARARSSQLSGRGRHQIELIKRGRSTRLLRLRACALKWWKGIGGTALPAARAAATSPLVHERL